MGFRVQIWSGGALWNPLSFLIKDSIQSNLWTGKESSLLKIQLVKNIQSPLRMIGFPVIDMVRFLYFLVNGIARIHDKILQLNDSSALFLSDKQLHFAIMGLIGMGLLLVIYPLFIVLSKKHVLAIAWIYVFTVMVVLSFAIEIGQGITNTGNVDLDDVISGLAGFMVLFIIFAVLRMIFLGIKNLLFPPE